MLYSNKWEIKMVMTDKFQNMQVEMLINSSKAFPGKAVDTIKNLRQDRWPEP